MSRSHKPGSSFSEVEALCLSLPGIALVCYWTYRRWVEARGVIDPVYFVLAWFALGFGLLAPFWNGPRRARILATAVNLASLIVILL